MGCSLIQQQALMCLPLLVLVLLTSAGTGRADGGQIPRPGGSADLEQSLSGIATGPSLQALQGVKDSQMMTTAALRNVLAALAQVAAKHPGKAGDPEEWLALQARVPRLMIFIKAGGPDGLLMHLLRGLLDDGSDVDALVAQKEELLLEFARAFDPAEFRRWAAGTHAERAVARQTGSSSGADSSTRRQKGPKHPNQRTKPTSPPPPTKPKGTPNKPTPGPPKAASVPGKQFPSPKPRTPPTKPAAKRFPSPKPRTPPNKPAAKSSPKPKAPTKPKPIGNDPKDPVDQLYDWARRVKALNGSLGYLVEGKAPRRGRSLLALDSELRETTAARASGPGGRALAASAAPKPANPPAASYKNVGFPWFKTRHIGVVFHMLQFRDQRKYLYPPQAYWNGDEPAKRLLAIINKMYLYSGTNIEFYLKDYRINVDMHPYLDMGKMSAWQDCGNTQAECSCKLVKNNYQPNKYINVYVAGSNAYRGATNKLPDLIAGETSATPGFGDTCSLLAGGSGAWDQKRSPRSQHVWYYFDFVDPLQYNSAQFANIGATLLGHEFGHVLGLRHAFNDEPATCNTDDDRVPDTSVSKQDVAASAAVMAELSKICDRIGMSGQLAKREQLSKFDSCPKDAYIDNVFNFMNYVPPPCNLLITRGQVRLMQKRAQKYLPDLGTEW